MPDDVPTDGGQKAEPDDDAFFADIRALGQAANDGDQDGAAEIVDKYKQQ